MHTNTQSLKQKAFVFIDIGTSAGLITHLEDGGFVALGLKSDGGCQTAKTTPDDDSLLWLWMMMLAILTGLNCGHGEWLA